MTETTSTIPKPKFVVGYAYHTSGVDLKDIFETTSVFDTYAEAKKYYDRLEMWQDGTTVLYQIFDNFIYDHIRNCVEYVKQNDCWVYYHTIEMFNTATEVYYDLQGNHLKTISYNLK